MSVVSFKTKPEDCNEILVITPTIIFIYLFCVANSTLVQSMMDTYDTPYVRWLALEDILITRYTGIPAKLFTILSDVTSYNMYMQPDVVELEFSRAQIL